MKRQTPRRFSTTPGTRDFLPPESTRLVAVQERVRERFRAHGFREVMTPAFEYSEVFEEPRLRDTAFKLFDPDNQMVILRPEMTTPIARLVAQRLTNSPPPHKLSYSLPVYRRASVGRGQSAEFHQAGVEVVGSTSAAEDAAVISLLIDALGSSGLTPSRDFAVVLGQTALYRGYLQSHAPDSAGEVLAALAAKDLVRVDDISRSLPPEVAAGVREIPRLVGPATDGGVVRSAARYAGEGDGAARALANLEEILAHLEAQGCLEAVILDLGLTGRYDYYTGAVYEAYSPDLGFTVASGGRYDNLLRRFGEPLPATGFAISLERLLALLPHDSGERLLVLVGGSVEATTAARRLRAHGVPVLHLAEDTPAPEAAAYARSVGAAWVAYPANGGLKLVGAASAGGTGGEGPEMVSAEEAARRVML